MPSTVIKHFDYDAERHELSVTFVPTGKTYVYFGVPPNVERDFRAASSRGRYFNLHIRNRYFFLEAGPARKTA